MTYLDKYPCCLGCPHVKYCGTVLASEKLCNSYNEQIEDVLNEICTYDEASEYPYINDDDY